MFQLYGSHDNQLSNVSASPPPPSRPSLLSSPATKDEAANNNASNDAWPLPAPLLDHHPTARVLRRPPFPCRQLPPPEDGDSGDPHVGARPRQRRPLLRDGPSSRAAAALGRAPLCQDRAAEEAGRAPARRQGDPDRQRRQGQVAAEEALLAACLCQGD